MTSPPQGSEPKRNNDPKRNIEPEDDEYPDPRHLKRLEAELAKVDEREQRGHATRPPRARGRTTPIAVRFDEFTIKRLKDLAARRNTGYQTLLKEFVVERLYEEEKRDRIIE
jgi:hypothetical protein